MNGNNPDNISFPVVTNWDDLSLCPFARKAWVHQGNIDVEKEYEKGDFLRVYCEHDIRWCDAEYGCDNCVICSDHMNE